MEYIDESKLNMVKMLLTSWNEVPEQRITDVLDVLTERKIACVPDPTPIYDMEPVIKQRDAAKMLGVSTKALAYHVKKGRIRIVRPEGAKRGMGYVAADIRALLAGTTGSAYTEAVKE